MSTEFCCLHSENHGDCTKESVAEWSNPDWLLHNCYYCGKLVAENHRSMNSIDSKNNLIGKKGYEVHVVQRIHRECMNKEENEIIKTHDWQRGERFSDRHGLPNPLEYRYYKAKCGCIITMFSDIDWRKYENEQFINYRSEGMSKFCWKHNIIVKWYFTLTGYSSVSSFLNKMALKENLFQSKDWQKKSKEFMSKFNSERPSLGKVS